MVAVRPTVLIAFAALGCSFSGATARPATGVPFEPVEVRDRAPADHPRDAPEVDYPPDDPPQEASILADLDFLSDEGDGLSLPPAEDSSDKPARADEVIDWVIATRDNGDLPFIVIDKGTAELSVFDPSGQLLSQTPVLIGIAKGDDSAPGIGDRELSKIPLAQRTTPAGRFQAKLGPAIGHKNVLWVDEEAAISVHPVVTSNPRERRLARLQSPTPADNRITFGCINVPDSFYSKVIEPLFATVDGIVYILPETRPLNEVFASLAPEDLPSRRPAAPADR